MESIEVNATITIPAPELEPVEWEVSVGNARTTLRREVKDGVVSYHEWGNSSGHETLADAVDAVIPRLRAHYVRFFMADLTTDLSKRQLEAR